MAKFCSKLIFCGLAKRFGRDIVTKLNANEHKICKCNKKYNMCGSRILNYESTWSSRC